MKRVAFAVCVVVLLFAVAISAQTSAQPTSESVEQELIKLENQWVDAVVKLDFTFLDRVLADDYTWTGADGNVVTKAQLVASLKSGEGGKVTSAVIDEMKVRVYGDAAVVLGRSTEKVQYKGEVTSGQVQWTDTWVKRAGRWQCVAEHISLIAQK